MNRLFLGLWKFILGFSVLMLLCLAWNEGLSVFKTLFFDLIGRSYAIEFHNFPCKIYYTERDWWFGQTHRFAVRIEKDDDGNPIWCQQEVERGKVAGPSLPFLDANAGHFEIRPTGSASSDGSDSTPEP
jgi:hypothetical protein